MVAEHPIVFVASLPRSGSTLMMQLLGQNPAHHVTPTNDLCDLVFGVRDSWMHKISFKAQGLKNVQPRVCGAISGLVRGFFADELAAGKTIFDKSRGWLSAIRLLEESFQRPVKVLCNIRDVRSIIASFEVIHRQSTMTKHGSSGPAYYDMQTIDGRAAQFLNKSAVVGLTINRLRDALNIGLADRVMLIPSLRLTREPITTLQNIHDWLKLPSFDYDVMNVKQLTYENDEVHGMKLHKIKEGPVLPERANSWEGILPVSTVAWLAIEYADINKLATL